MVESWLDVDPDVGAARTPPSELYGDPAWHARINELVWLRAWQYLQAVDVAAPHTAIGLTLLDEPLVFTRHGGAEYLLSNVCTHRGAVLVQGDCLARALRCPYHGRRFRLDGTVTQSPGFDGAPGFPRARDHLVRLPLGRFGPWRFGAVEPPPTSADEWLAPLAERLPFADLEGLVQHPAGERHHVFEASWALYVENYLEGFHIPFVHPGLAKVLDGQEYRVEPLENGVLQVGVAREGAPSFHLPAGHPDHGLAIGGYFLWLFPGTMFNVYPWGVSMNQVEPLGPTRTCVHYRVWVHDLDAPLPDVDTVELEDQAVVLRTQAGVRARHYPGGHYAPAHERGTHHFHRLLAAALRG